jgi:cystathionine beta-lyase
LAFDFDELVDRHGQWSLKWERYAGHDVIPMWVADMDFRCPPEITDILRARVEHGVFGYVEPGPELVDAIAARLASSYGWSTNPDWYVWLPGLVSGLNVACRAVGEPGDDVLTGVPIYPPFLTAPRHASRNCVRVPLGLDEGRWRFDAGTLAQAITPRSRLLLLCSPHNPVGRAWSREELLALANVAAENDLAICSDEIHCGLVLDAERPHVPIAALAPEIADRTITLMAASKTFNLPALGCAFAIVPNAQLRSRIHRVMAGLVHRPLGLGLWATLAAYRDGEPWRQALIEYLRANRDLVAARIAAMPGVATTPVEATYLSWIDCRGAGLEQPAKFFESAGVGLYDGADFGTPGWVRLNFATRRARLVEALDRMERALDAGIRTTR